MYYPTYEAQVTWSQLGINSSEYSFQAFVAEVQVDPLNIKRCQLLKGKTNFSRIYLCSAQAQDGVELRCYSL